MRISNFVIEYVCENEIFRQTVLGCSLGARRWPFHAASCPICLHLFKHWRFGNHPIFLVFLWGHSQGYYSVPSWMLGSQRHLSTLSMQTMSSWLFKLCFRWADLLIIVVLSPLLLLTTLLYYTVHLIFCGGKNSLFPPNFGTAQTGQGFWLI